MKNLDRRASDKIEKEIAHIMEGVDKEETQFLEETRYLDLGKTKGKDVKIEVPNDKKQHEEIDSIIKRGSRRENDVGDFSLEEEEFLEKAGKKKNPFIDDIEYKNRVEYEEAKEQKLESGVKKVIDNIIGIEQKNGKIKEINSLERITEIIKNNKIDEIVVSGGEKKISNEEKKLFTKKEIKEAGEKIITFGQDLDSKTTLWLLNDFNKKGSLEKIYSEGAKSTIINTRKKEEEPEEKIKGLRVFIDAGGEWIKFKENGETTTIWIDHHGSGKRDPTSGTKMMYEIMEQADLLKEKPEWLKKFVNFVNDVDNLTYIEKKNVHGRKIFDENYFRNEWPNSLYSLAEKHIPFETLIKLCESGMIKDPSVPFTTEELNGEIGKIKIGKSTIKELCDEQRRGVANVLERVRVTKEINEKAGLNLETESLGKIIYHNYQKNEKGEINVIPDHLAFKATKAKNFDTYISWNKQKEIFFINSNHPNLSAVVEKLNKVDPDCATDVRGVMVFGKIKNLTEEQFLNIIDPNILKNREDKDVSAQEEKESGLTTEEEKKLTEAETNIKTEDNIIAEAEDKLKKLYAELKLAKLKEDKEAKTLAKEEVEVPKIN